MKLLIATGLYPPEVGGPATYTKFLEKHLPRHGIACSVLPYSTVRKFPKIIRHLAYLMLLIRRSKGSDGFYALDTVSVGLSVLLAHMLTRKPYLLRVPGDYAWEQGQQRFGVTEDIDTFLQHKKHPLAVRVLSWIQRNVASQAQHIIVPSDYMEEIVSSWGVPQAKITRVYSELTPITISESKEELRKAFSYGEEFVVVTSCRLVPWKGVGGLIAVIGEMKNEGYAVTLEVLGDGVLREALTKQVQDANLSDVVRFRGVCERAEMGKWIKAADLFVLNTSYEGLSHQLLEVMSLGTPIVTTSVGGNPELIEHERSGLLVPFNDTQRLRSAIEKIYHNRELGRVFARHAQEALGRFHEDVVSNELKLILETIWKS